LVPNFLRGYDFRISGKPLWKLPANIPVVFELTVLLSAFGAFFGMLAANNLPCWYQELFSSQRFKRVTRDRFFLGIAAADPRFDEGATHEFLSDLAGTHIECVWSRPTAERPGWIGLSTAVLFGLALLPLAWVYKARTTKSPEPRLQVIADMDNQQRYKAQQPNRAFADGRAMRPTMEGVIARGDTWAVGTDPHFYEGRVAGEWATKLPPQIELDERFLLRGQERFNIYCAVCHGFDGSGQGAVAMRLREKPQMATGWAPPSSLHDPTTRQRPLGHVFHTITNGIRTMPAHGDQIPPRDRWAIVAYVRALQRSQNATIEDVPVERRVELK
jgi:mono/diheme cytochrome c family protein